MVWRLSIIKVSFFFLVSFSLLSFVLCLYSISMGESVVVEWEVLSINSCAIEMGLIFDAMSLSFLSLVSLISSMVLSYSGGYMEGDMNINRFLYLVLGFVVSMCLLIVSPNLISILLGWDGLGLISYALVIYYQNEKSANAGMLTVLSNRVGDVAILIGIAMMCGFGGWNFVFYTEGMVENSGLAWVFILIGGMTKSAQIPFSAWLPAAMAAPTPVSALVHSSTLVTAGVYLLIRFSPMLEGTLGSVFLLFVSSLTMVMAGLGANFETDMKKIIALSTLSQLGVMMSTLAMGYPMLAFFHLMTHALFKALLFMCAGCMIHGVGGSQDIRVMGCLVGSMPISVSCMNLANLALCGMPFLAGFYSKDLILEMALSSPLGDVGLWMLMFATGLTASYSLRLSYYSLVGVYNVSSLGLVGDENVKMSWPILTLSVGAVVGGSVFSWVLFPSPYLVCLSLWAKTLALVVSVVGARVGYIVNEWSAVVGSVSMSKNYIMSEFFSKMWFMEFLFTKFVSSKSLPGGSQVYSLGDKGWMEFYGGQGLHTVFTNTSWALGAVQGNMVKLHMMSFLAMVGVVFILIGLGV